MTEDINTHVTRNLEVDGKHIIVYDGLITPQEAAGLSHALDQNAFTHNEIARPDTAQFKHWAINLKQSDAESLPIYQPTLRASELFGGDEDKYRIYRAYCNYSQFGDMLFTHTDCMPGSKELTALWYIAAEWNVEWGGETLFFDSHQDAQAVVSPKPGRLVVFDGSLTHVGRPPNRICVTPRYTFAFKLETY